MVVDSCPLVPVSKDALTPAIAVLSESFTADDFVIDCEGCTACCKGHDGVKLDDEELLSYDCHKDEKGEWRVDVDDAGWCTYLDAEGCSIHGEAPRRCKEFDCRAAVIFFGNVGIDELVREAKLPLDVVTMGRKKLDEWNNVMNLRALAGGGDLSFLMKGDEDATP